MLYRLPTTGATAPAFTLTGRNIAHAHRSVPERAFIGAGLHLGHIGLTSPTMKQSAALVDVCTAYVAAAVDIVDDLDVRDAVLHGEINIIDAAKRSTARESLADHIRRSTPAVLAAAARATGIDLIWDSMLQPNLA